MPPCKQLLQRLCKGCLGWDQPIIKPNVAAWEGWAKVIRRVGVIRIPRSLVEKKEDGVSTEFHMFCDASENESGAAAYAWRKPANKSAHGVLPFSKSRVEPTKPVTIPGLELSATALGVRVGEVAGGALPNAF